MAAIATAAIAPAVAHAALASAAGIVLESLPYIVGAALLSRLSRRYAAIAGAYAGCGCSTVGAARSLPAALATAAIFGPAVALARVAAATVTASVFGGERSHAHPLNACGEVARLMPAAAVAGIVAAILPSVPLHALAPVAALLAGGAIGIFASPCMLGAVALAGALRVHAPFAAAGILASAGIAGFRRTEAHRSVADDRIVYALLSLACAVVAWQHGAALVHPKLTYPLWGCALYCALAARRSSDGASMRARIAAIAITVAAIAGAPAPAYTATETTLADAFAGEHLAFTGLSVDGGARTTLVRYAITCCRADAAPVSVQLDRRVRPNQWFRADGVLRTCGATLCLHAERIQAIAPPADPFVYL